MDLDGDLFTAGPAAAAAVAAVVVAAASAVAAAVAVDAVGTDASETISKAGFRNS